MSQVITYIPESVDDKCCVCTLLGYKYKRVVIHISICIYKYAV